MSDALHFFFSIWSIGDLLLLPSVTALLLFGKNGTMPMWKTGVYMFPIDITLPEFAKEQITWGLEVVWRQLCSVLLGNWRVLPYFFCQVCQLLRQPRQHAWMVWDRIGVFQHMDIWLFSPQKVFLFLLVMPSLGVWGITWQGHLRIRVFPNSWGAVQLKKKNLSKQRIFFVTGTKENGYELSVASGWNETQITN